MTALPSGINPQRYQTFSTIYREKLVAAVTKEPQEYGYPVEEAPGVAIRMMHAIAADDYNASASIWATCRQLGIKTTKTALREWLHGTD